MILIKNSKLFRKIFYGYKLKKVEILVFKFPYPFIQSLGKTKETPHKKLIFYFKSEFI